MRSKTIFAALMTAVIVLLSSGTSQALKMHNFECGQCHKSGVTWTSLDAGNLCLQCHGSTPATGVNMIDEYSCVWDGTAVVCTSTVDPDSPADATDGWAVGDASNELGSNPSPGNEISHVWGASLYNRRAGSAPHPTDPMYNDTTAPRQASGSSVTCFRCHDPHGAKADTGSDPTTNKLVRLPNYDKSVPSTMSPDTPEKIESICVVCHADWAAYVDGSSDGHESHPLVVDYPTFQSVNSDRYKVFAPNGEMQLLNAGADIGCSSCHGLHYSDSDSLTADGAGVTGGDGALLRGDGLANDPSALCQSCHEYLQHPSSSGTNMGCLHCHSGHSVNKDGSVQLLPHARGS